MARIFLVMRSLCCILFISCDIVCRFRLVSKLKKKIFHCFQNIQFSAVFEPLVRRNIKIYVYWQLLKVPIISWIKPIFIVIFYVNKKLDFLLARNAYCVPYPKLKRNADSIVLLHYIEIWISLFLEVT